MANLRAQASAMRQDFFGSGSQGVMPRMRQRLLDSNALLTSHERRVALNYMEKVVGLEMDMLLGSIRKGRDEDMAISQLRDMQKRLREADGMSPRQILGKLPSLQLGTFLRVLGVNGKDAELAEYFEEELVPGAGRLELRSASATSGSLFLANPDQEIGSFSVGFRLVPLEGLENAKIPVPILSADYLKTQNSFLVRSLFLHAALEGSVMGEPSSQFEQLFALAGTDFNSFRNSIVGKVSSAFGCKDDAVTSQMDSTSTFSFVLRSVSTSESKTPQGGSRELVLEGRWVFSMPSGDAFGMGIKLPDAIVAVRAPGDYREYAVPAQK